MLPVARFHAKSRAEEQRCNSVTAREFKMARCCLWGSRVSLRASRGPQSRAPICLNLRVRPRLVSSLFSRQELLGTSPRSPQGSHARFAFGLVVAIAFGRRATAISAIYRSSIHFCNSLTLRLADRDHTCCVFAVAAITGVPLGTARGAERRGAGYGCCRSSEQQQQDSSRCHRASLHQRLCQVAPQ